MPMPTNEAEIKKLALQVVSGWRLEHHPSATLIHAMMLGFKITRDDYNRIVKAYVDTQDEALSLRKKDD